MAPTRVQDSGSGLIIMETESINKNIMFAACCQSHVQQNMAGGGAMVLSYDGYGVRYWRFHVPDVGTKIRQ